MGGEGIVGSASLFCGTAKLPEVKLFLEVEVFNHNLENGQEVEGRFGDADSFKVFNSKDKGEVMQGWKRISSDPECQVLQNEVKRVYAPAGYCPLPSVDPKNCENHAAFCNISCPHNQGVMKIMAQRKYVAFAYDDGTRSYSRTTPRNVKNGKWPDNVKLEQRTGPAATEELLLRVIFFKNGTEAAFEKAKVKEAIPTVNKIFILQKVGGIESVIDREVKL